MIELAMPTLTPRELMLESVDPLRGQVYSPDEKPSPLEGRIFLGGPYAHQVTPAFVADDPELKLSATVRTPEPVAVSMSPRRITDVAEIQSSFRLGPQLALAGVEASLGEVGKSMVRRESEVFLQALRLLRTDPMWEFRRTKTMDILGSYDLVMVVRTARDAVAGLTCTVTASTKGHLLRWYRRELPHPLRLEAVL